jgi:hypothetical protein
MSHPPGRRCSRAAVLAAGIAAAIASTATTAAASSSAGSQTPGASGDLTSVVASGNGYSLRPPVATSATFPGSTPYTPKPPQEGDDCIAITPLSGQIVHLMNEQGDAQRYTAYSLDVIPSLTGGPTTYSGTVTVTLPDGQSQTMPIDSIITMAADEQGAATEIAGSFNTAFQTEVAGIPLIGGLLSSISPYTAADFPINFAPVSAGAPIHAEDVGTWVPHVTVYLQSIPQWHYKYDWVIPGDPNATPPTQDQHINNAGPNRPAGAQLVSKHDPYCDPLRIVSVSPASAQQPVPAVVAKAVPPLMDTLAGSIWASYQWGNIETTPKGGADGAGTVNTYVNVPTYAWLQPPPANPLPRARKAYRPIMIPVAAMANAPVMVSEWWQVIVTPDTVHWNFDGSAGGTPNTCAATNPTGYGNQPPRVPEYDGTRQMWTDGAGGPASNLDPVVHQYTSVAPPSAPKTINACQVFHFEIIGIMNDGVNAAPQVIADEKYDKVANWTDGPITVDQIQGVPVFGGPPTHG